MLTLKARTLCFSILWGWMQEVLAGLGLPQVVFIYGMGLVCSQAAGVTCKRQAGRQICIKYNNCFAIIMIIIQNVQQWYIDISAAKWFREAGSPCCTLCLTWYYWVIPKNMEGYCMKKQTISCPEVLQLTVSCFRQSCHRRGMQWVLISLSLGAACPWISNATN